MTKEKSDNLVAYATNELYHRIVVEGYSEKRQVRLEADSFESLTFKWYTTW
jgi:hypothetical protein